MGIPPESPTNVITIAKSRIAALREGLEAIRLNLSPRDAATLKVLQGILTADDLLAEEMNKAGQVFPPVAYNAGNTGVKIDPSHLAYNNQPSADDLATVIGGPGWSKSIYDKQFVLTVPGDIHPTFKVTPDGLVVIPQDYTPEPNEQWTVNSETGVIKRVAIPEDPITMVSAVWTVTTGNRRPGEEVFLHSGPTYGTSKDSGVHPGGPIDIKVGIDPALDYGIILQGSVPATGASLEGAELLASKNGFIPAKDDDPDSVPHIPS